MYDSVPGVTERKISDTVLRRVGSQTVDGFARRLVGDRLVLIKRRDIVVAGGESPFRTEDFQSSGFQCTESLRGRHLMHQVAVYVQHIRPVRDMLHHMAVPYLVKKRLSHDILCKIFS